MSRENELQRVMAAISGRKVTILTPAKIVEAVCSTLEIQQCDMESPLRSRENAECRFIIAHLLNSACNLSVSNIGKYMGYRHRGTVMHGLIQYENLKYSSVDFREKIQLVTDRLEELCG